MRLEKKKKKKRKRGSARILKITIGRLFLYLLSYMKGIPCTGIKGRIELIHPMAEWPYFMFRLHENLHYHANETF